MGGLKYSQVQVGKITWHVAIEVPMVRYHIHWYRTTAESRALGDTVGAKGYIELDNRRWMQYSKKTNVARWLMTRGIPAPVAIHIVHLISGIERKKNIRQAIHQKRLDRERAKRKAHEKLLTKISKAVTTQSRPEAQVPKALAVVPKKEIVVKVDEKSQWEADRKEAYDSLPSIEWDTEGWLLPEPKVDVWSIVRVGARILFITGYIAAGIYFALSM